MGKRTAAAKLYAIARGRSRGIFRTWEMARAQVDRYDGALHKSFPSMDEAEQWLAARPVTGCGAKRTHERTYSADASLSAEQRRFVESSSSC